VLHYRKKEKGSQEDHGSEEGDRPAENSQKVSLQNRPDMVLLVHEYSHENGIQKFYKKEDIQV
jgi:hypothetical protein